MRVYEEYNTPAEKHRAQRGAKRGKPTGKARGYFFAFNENGREKDGGWGGMGAVYGDTPPGATPEQCGLAGTSASLDYLRTHCRRVGACHLPPAWRKVWEGLAQP